MKDKIYKYDFASLLQIEFAKQGKQVSYQSCIDFINVFQDTISELLGKDCEISLVNFGNFIVKEYDKQVPYRGSKKIKTWSVVMPKLNFSKNFRDKLKEKRKNNT